jgi:hypothetical protein
METSISVGCGELGKLGNEDGDLAIGKQGI